MSPRARGVNSDRLTGRLGEAVRRDIITEPIVSARSSLGIGPASGPAVRVPKSSSSSGDSRPSLCGSGVSGGIRRTPGTFEMLQAMPSRSALGRRSGQAAEGQASSGRLPGRSTLKGRAQGSVTANPLRGTVASAARSRPRFRSVPMGRCSGWAPVLAMVAFAPG